MGNIKHRRLSVKTRNAEVINRIMNSDITSEELAQEYHVQWNTIRDSIRDNHYQVVSRPYNEKRYQDFLAKVRKNNAAAAKANASKQSAEVITNNDTVNTGADSSSQATEELTTTIAASSDKKTVFLVETGFLLHTDFDTILGMDDGNAIFMIPRFCINELRKMSLKREDVPVKKQAKTVLLRMYAEDIWEKRFIPFEPIEQGMIPKTPDIQGYKSRSFGIAEAALELYLDSNYKVIVLTNAMEIQHLVIRMTKAENLTDEITVTRVYKPSK